MSYKKVLVAYYSRTGNTRCVAQKIKETIGCDIEEIIDKENRKGIIGFLKSGYQALKGIPAEIEENSKEVSQYDLVVIGTPVWAGRVSCAVRRYIIKNKDKFKNLAYFSTQMGTNEDRVFEDMEELCGRKPLYKVRFTNKQIKNGEYAEKIKKLHEILFS
ncbi:MAG: flavodoxin [Firmicutes bacterium]|jgi:flavodoxin|nr:flavodoxin [Bacillota bacterium]